MYTIAPGTASHKSWVTGWQKREEVQRGAGRPEGRTCQPVPLRLRDSTDPGFFTRLRRLRDRLTSFGLASRSIAFLPLCACVKGKRSLMRTGSACSLQTMKGKPALPDKLWAVQGMKGRELPDVVTVTWSPTVTPAAPLCFLQHYSPTLTGTHYEVGLLPFLLKEICTKWVWQAFWSSSQRLLE